MTPALTFRKAIPEDAPALAELNRQLIQDEGHRSRMTLPELETRMRQWLAGEYEAHLFYQDEQICGYAIYRREPEWVYVRQFFITRDQRRVGLGQAALHWLHRHVWQDTRRIRLEVLVGNQTGIAFLESLRL